MFWVWLFCWLVALAIGVQRERPILGFFLGLFLGPFAWPLLFIVSKGSSGGATKLCGTCRQPMPYELKRCPNCRAN